MTKQKPILNEVRLHQDELYKCVNCGLCQSVCPPFLADHHEGKTARGKIIMLRDMLEGSIEPSARITELFDDCLTCYACQSICPSGVQTEKLWTAARQDLGNLSSTSRMKKIGLAVTIGSPFIFRAITRVGGWFGQTAGEDGGVNLDALIPFPAKGAPFLHLLKEEYPAVGEEHGSVGLLLGCSVNLYAPTVADAAIKILTMAGFRVIIPKKQVCCGAPAINNASWGVARKLARRTIKVFDDLDTNYITSCDATCAGAMINDYKEIFSGEKEGFANAEKFSRKVLQLGELMHILCDSGWLSFKTTALQVTVHDSCHSTHYLEGRANWRDILGRINGLEIIEMAESEHCCGFGGSYAFLHKEDSGKIASRKLQNAIDSGAKTVLVGSPGCALRLRTTRKNNNLEPIRIVHSIELLSELACKSVQKKKARGKCF